MSTKYCDHLAYGAYAAVPTWGAAQDGDGTATTPGTPSTAEIVFTGVPSSGVINVLGVPVTVTWATSATNCANLLATAINALATVAVGPASFTTKSQVRNHLYARGPANGAPANTCQIMTRQASADHAGLIAITHTLNNVSSPATINFSGGSGGAWGYMLNPAVIWPSAVALGGYGWYCGIGSYTGSRDPGDVVEVRSGKTITLPNSTTFTMAASAMGSASAPVVFRIDDGTVWPADGSTPVLKFTQLMNGTVQFHTPVAACFAVFAAKKYASGQRSLVFEVTGGSSFQSAIRLSAGGSPCKWDNVDFVCAGTYPTSQNVVVWTGGPLAINAQLMTMYHGCRLVWPGQSTGTYLQAINGGGLDLDNCELAQTSPDSAQSVGLFNFFVGGTTTSRYRINALKCTGFVAGSRLRAQGAWPEGVNVAFTDCDFGNVTVRGPTIANTALAAQRALAGCYGASNFGARDFFSDTNQGFVEWNSSRGYPTLNARLLDGVTPWVIFATPTNQAVNISTVSPLRLPNLVKINTLATASRTATVRVLVESTLGWTGREISAAFSYRNSAGDFVLVNTFDGAAPALSASAATWSSTTYNGQTWLAKEFAVMLPDLPFGAELTAIVAIHTSVTNDTLGVFVDPEIGIA